MKKILEELDNVKSIGISGHIRPDGDCVGSCMAMYMYLKKAMPEDTDIDVIFEKPSPVFDCIAHIEDRRDYPRRQAYDVFIALDCTPDRMGDALIGYEKAKKTINIDHHISNTGAGDINYIFPKASSASELVYELLDKEYIDVHIAQALYIGIIHDSGVLQYSNTSPKTLRIVAELVEYGFDFSKLIDETFYQKSYIQNQILGRALSESILMAEGKCIACGLTKEMLDFYGVKPVDLDGIVSQLRYTKGVEVAIFMYELDKDKWKISLRSNGLVDVSKVATFFGGGGHVRASGCLSDGRFEDITGSLVEKITLQF